MVVLNGVWARRVLVVPLILGACSSSSSSSSSSSAPVTPATAAVTSTSAAAPQAITVQAGINDPADQHIAVRVFMPSEISVHVGTKVTWVWDGAREPHSVSFYPGDQRPPFPPDPKGFGPLPATGPLDGTNAASSGLQPTGPQPAQPFSVSFAKAGTYKYYCVLHPTMVGTVNVTEASGAQDSASAVAAKGKTEMEQYLAEGEAASKQLASAKPETTQTSDGATTYTVQMGVSTRHTDVNAFGPTPVNLKAGDKVMFLNDSLVVHTASFFNGHPAIRDPEDPAARKPAPGTSPQTLNTTDLFNTGALLPNAPPGAGPPVPVRSFIFKVPASGTYSYICIYHANQAMAGTIVAS